MSLENFLMQLIICNILKSPKFSILGFSKILILGLAKFNKTLFNFRFS